MGRRPPSICCEPRCPKIATSRGRCDEHRCERQRDEKRIQREYDRLRGSRHERGYDSRWAKASAAFLERHRWCRPCEKLGIRTPATAVDHIKPHGGDRGLFWARSNWQPICHAHHNEKTGAERTEARRRRERNR